MHAASRDSLAAARERLDAYIDGASADDLGRLADELIGVAGLLDREGGLRRALADASASPQARTDLVGAVLADRVSPTTVDQLQPLVQARWSTPTELVDAVEALARQAAFGAAERAGTLDEVEDELFRFGRILAAEPQLRMLLSDPRTPAEGRAGLLDQLVGGRVNPATGRLLDAAVRVPRGRSLDVTVDELVRLAAVRRERYIAYVRAASALTERQESRMTDTLARIYGRPVSLRVEVDPDLLGGLLVRVNDEVIDGSVANRLDAARRRLAG